MHLFRFTLAALLGAAGGAEVPAPAVASTWLLPPVEGRLQGDFTPLFLPGAPPVRWRVDVRSDQPRVRSLDVAVEGKGLKVQGTAVLDPGGEGTWTLGPTVIDLGEWFGWVAPRWLPAAGGADFAGRLTLAGDGTWRGGIVDGRIEARLRAGRFEDAGRRVVIEDLSLDLVVEDLRGRRTQPGQVLTWRGGRYDTVPFGAGRVEFALEGDGLRVARAELELFGGELATGAWLWRWDDPTMSVTAQLRGLEVGNLLFLLPPVLAAAQGRIDGRIALHRSAAGIAIGAGALALRQGEVADLRFAPTPGLLSAHLPTAVRKHYTGLGRLETGGMPLRAERLEVVLTPHGDDEGRTAVVRIEGGPADPELKAPVVLQINVRGPLDSLLRFGTDSKLGFGGTPKETNR